MRMRMLMHMCMRMHMCMHMPHAMCSMSTCVRYLSVEQRRMGGVDGSHDDGPVWNTGAGSSGDVRHEGWQARAKRRVGQSSVDHGIPDHGIPGHPCRGAARSGRPLAARPDGGDTRGTDAWEGHAVA